MTTAAVDHLPLPLLRSGKVREVYEADAGRLLLVASDRVSAFDVIMRERVPYKGAVLTQITAWWLQQLESEVPHHMLASTADDIVAAVPSLGAHRSALAGRAMLCRRTTVFPVECVVRDYLDAERRAGRWNGEAPPPTLPDGVVAETSARYLDAYRRITGAPLDLSDL